MNTRKLWVVGAGIGLVILTAFISQKKAQLTRIIEQLQFRVSGIRNVQLSWQHIALELDIQFRNPTKEHLNINTGFISAKELQIYEKKTGKQLAFTKLNTHKISIPSGGMYQLPPTHINLPVLTVGQLVFEELQKKQQDFIKALRFELDVASLGNTQTVQF
ncbi:hypothetical protein HBA12_03430 [Tenacibaculum mesophilum]|uniref:hypothetical protein n=1 Tax=Tenacibaculum mesophilum TaxID=104268 RepID=UPI001430B347|nr:hypothetical protein [Tenacibaculum mesophilum]KAF9659312.1 hypothetical protein HBA12_03430 [Tenacibaculum mesophilum]